MSGTELLGDDRVEAVGVECYETGKVFECGECGQDFGTEYGESMWNCPGCGVVVVDPEAGDRSYDPDDDPNGGGSEGNGEQTDLADFV